MGFLVKQQQLLLKAFPTPIQFIKYSPADYHPNGVTELLTELIPKQQLPESFNQWVSQRQAQFLAGRIAAKNALLKINNRSIDIKVGKHREPLWSKGIIGSISHSKNISIATVLKLSSNKNETANEGCGLDIQHLFSKKEYDEALPLILSKHDQSLFEEQESNFSTNQLATLVFSAKESYFKAVFNQVGKYFGFNEVSILSIDINNKQLTLRSDKNSTIPTAITLIVHYEFLVIDSNIKSVITFCSYHPHSPIQLLKN